MEKAYNVVRLVALWTLFILAVGLSFWAVQHLAVSVIKTATGAYLTPTSTIAGSPSGTYCLQYPSYPPTVMGGVDEAAMKKYDAAMEKYNQEYAKLCQQDLDKQAVATRNQERFNSWGDLVQYFVLTVLGVIASFMSLEAIKKREQA